jgi:hypothetical protein
LHDAIAKAHPDGKAKKAKKASTKGKAPPATAEEAPPVPKKKKASTKSKTPPAAATDAPPPKKEPKKASVKKPKKKAEAEPPPEDAAPDEVEWGAVDPEAEAKAQEEADAAAAAATEAEAARVAQEEADAAAVAAATAEADAARVAQEEATAAAAATAEAEATRVAQEEAGDSNVDNSDIYNGGGDDDYENAPAIAAQSATMLPQKPSDLEGATTGDFGFSDAPVSVAVTQEEFAGFDAEPTTPQSAATAATPRAAASSGNAAAKLAECKTLLDAGLITQKDYDEVKQSCIAEMLSKTTTAHAPKPDQTSDGGSIHKRKEKEPDQASVHSGFGNEDQDQETEGDASVHQGHEHEPDQASVHSGFGNEEQETESEEISSKKKEKESVKKAGKSGTIGGLCQRPSPSGGTCTTPATTGTTFCTNHTCPECGVSKSGKAAGCPVHEEGTVASNEKGSKKEKKSVKKAGKSGSKENVITQQPSAAKQARKQPDSSVGVITDQPKAGFCGRPEDLEDVKFFSAEGAGGGDNPETKTFRLQAFLDYVEKHFKKKKLLKTGIKPADLTKLFKEDEKAAKHLKEDSSSKKGDPAAKCTYKSRDTKGVNPKRCGAKQTMTEGSFCRNHSCGCGRDKRTQEVECKACDINSNLSAVKVMVDKMTLSEKGTILFKDFEFNLKNIDAAGEVDADAPEESKLVQLPQAELKEAIKKHIEKEKSFVMDAKKQVAVHVFLNKDTDAAELETKKKQKNFGEAVDWLIHALDVAPHEGMETDEKHEHSDSCPKECTENHEHSDSCPKECKKESKDINDLVKELLATYNFSRGLNEVDSKDNHVHSKEAKCEEEACTKQKKTQFDRLRDGANGIAQRIGQNRLAKLYNQFHLEDHLSKENVEELVFKHQVLKEREENGMDTTKASQEWAIPELYQVMAKELSFDVPTSMAQRVSLIATLMYSNLLRDDFNTSMETIADKIPGCDFAGAPVKGYSRAFNKIYQDYKDLAGAGGRSAWIMDPLRCLLTGATVKSIKTIFKALIDETEGLLQYKNPFSMNEADRQDRSNLLLMNVSVLYNSKKTVGELISGPRAQKVFDDFCREEGKKCKEPKERWDDMCKQAMGILKRSELGNAKAMIGGEVQITLTSFKNARHDMYGACFWSQFCNNRIPLLPLAYT